MREFHLPYSVEGSCSARKAAFRELWEETGFSDGRYPENPRTPGVDSIDAVGQFTSPVWVKDGGYVV